MSVEIFGFLGNQLDSLEERLIKKFEEFGFEIKLDPSTNLLGFSTTSSIPTIRIAILKTPNNLLRLSPNTPLFVGFEYYAVPKKDVLSAPRKIQNYSYLAYTRTSAGRSIPSGYMQMLLIAILASITDGKYFGLGDEKPTSGEATLKNILASLSNKEKNYQELLANYKNKKRWSEKSQLLTYLNASYNSPFFDEDAIPFIGWYQEYNSELNQPIKNLNKVILKNQNFFIKWFKRLSWFEILGYIVMVYFLIVLIKSEM